jgi:hypothetical protein
MNWLKKYIKTQSTGIEQRTQAVMGTTVPSSCGMLGCTCGNCWVSGKTTGVGAPIAPFWGTSSAHSTVPFLSAEELEEHKKLCEDRVNALRSLRLEVFKKLPAELRQNVLNMLMWAQAVSDMNNISVPSPRLDELSARLGTAGSSIPSNVFLRAAYVGSPQATAIAYISLPDGLSVEDLNKAHSEAVLEEQLLRQTDE